VKRLRDIWFWLMNQIKVLSELEPAAFRSGVVTVVSALAAVGVRVAPGVPETVVTVVTAIVTVSALVSGWWTRRAVTANSRVVVMAPDPIGRPRTVEPGEATTRASDHAILDAARSTPADANVG